MHPLIHYTACWRAPLAQMHPLIHFCSHRRAPLPAACSVPPVFSSRPHRQVYVACLNGTVSAWQVRFSTPAPTRPSLSNSTERISGWDAGLGNVGGSCGVESSSRGTAEGEGEASGAYWSFQGATQVELRPSWCARPHPKSAPIFSTPAVDESAEVLVFNYAPLIMQLSNYAGVEKVRTLKIGFNMLHPHTNTQVWSRDLQAGLVFAPLSLGPPCFPPQLKDTRAHTQTAAQMQPHTACGTHRSQHTLPAATVSNSAPSSSTCGEQLLLHTTCSVRPPQHSAGASGVLGDAPGCAQFQQSAQGVMVGTHGGFLLWLCCKSGRIRWRVQVGKPCGVAVQYELPYSTSVAALCCGCVARVGASCGECRNICMRTAMLVLKKNVYVSLSPFQSQ
eukprot:1140443-Pelagomonas_calceolata.AAC.4